MVMLEVQDILTEMTRIMALVSASVNHRHLPKEKRSVGVNSIVLAHLCSEI